MKYTPYRIPISIKGIIFENESVWLRKNERQEWELPGGKLDKGEQPEETVVRELEEELGFQVEVIDIISSDIHTVPNHMDESDGVLIISYLCQLKSKRGEFEIEGEGGISEFKRFPISKIQELNMPEFFKKAIFKAHAR